jgi:photosystem II stability/assembly factor-like uncharacterized protein
VATAFRGHIYTSTDSGVTWVPRESVRDWEEIASSSDGRKLVAIAPYDFIYTSADSGATWVPRGKKGLWKDIASSADGKRLVAAELGGGQIYSSHDYGASWVPVVTDSSHLWHRIAISSDGIRIVAVAVNDGIYTSIDTGKISIKGTVTIKKVFGANYIAIFSNAPDTEYAVVATKTGSKTITFTGKTAGNGAASIKLKQNLVGYKLSLKIPSK